MTTVPPFDPPHRGLLSVCCAAMLVVSLAALLGQARRLASRAADAVVAE